MAQQSILDEEAVACWKQRWRALELMFEPEYKRLDVLQGYSEQSSDEQRQNYRINALTQLLHNLHVFGESQFRFFLTGFAQSPELFDLPQGLQGSKTYAEYESPYSIAEFVLSTIVDQISYDLVAISKAIDQRLALVTGDRKIFDQSVLADRLALGALMMVNNSFGLDNHLINVPYPPTTVLTYLRMSSTVRVIPYARVAFIGIPLTAVQAREDLLAIPHEVGHYLYWKTRLDEKSGEIKRTRPLANLMPSTSPIDHWQEEIFADIIACWIGGPLVALSMQARMRTAISRQFLRDDGTYPIPALRPWIYIYVLREKMKMTSIADALEAQWQSVLTDRQIKWEQPAIILQADAMTTCQPISMANLWEVIKKVIDQIWKELIEKFDLFGQNSVDQDSSELRWSLPETPLAELRTQFFNALEGKQPGNFLDRIDQRIDKKLNFDPDPTLPKQPSTLDDTPKVYFWKKLAEEQLFMNGHPEWWQPEDDNAFVKPNTQSIPATDWLKLFEFGGWTAEGPDNQPGKK